MGKLADSDTDTDTTEVPKGTKNLNEETPLTLAETFELGGLTASLIFGGHNNYVPFSEGKLDLSGVARRIEQKLKESDIDSTIEQQISDVTERTFEGYDEGEPLNEKDGQQLSNHASSWDQTLSAELENEKRIAVESIGLFDVESAMRSPESIFDTHVWDWLNDRSQNDVREACQSLAVDCSTAATMLSLRAVEDSLRRWYKDQTGDDLGGPWGRVLDNLEDEYPNDNLSILSNLDYLRDKRNEVMHPDKLPTSEEAVTTLYMVRQTISEIYDEIGADEEA